MAPSALHESRDIFLRGDYADVVARGTSAGAPAGCIPYLIGALAYVGRKEEAEALFEANGSDFSSTAASACLFFLGIARCRAGDFHRGQTYLARNLRLARRRGASAKTRFFAIQGLGFYRYVSCRYARSARIAERAFAIAAGARFVYGMALASDLLGHGLCQTGFVEAGISRLQDAKRLAAELGDGGLARSIGASTVAYRAQFGLESKTAVESLERAFADLAPQNAHAGVSLLLELANQLALRGRLESAISALDRCSTLIYR